MCLRHGRTLASETPRRSKHSARGQTAAIDTAAVSKRATTMKHSDLGEGSSSSYERVAPVGLGTSSDHPVPLRVLVGRSSGELSESSSSQDWTIAKLSDHQVSGLVRPSSTLVEPSSSKAWTPEQQNRHAAALSDSGLSSDRAQLRTGPRQVRTCIMLRWSGRAFESARAAIGATEKAIGCCLRIRWLVRTLLAQEANIVITPAMLMEARRAWAHRLLVAR